MRDAKTLDAMIDAELDAEQAALHIEHRELQAEQERLHAPPFDPDAQAALTDRLRRHTARIRAYVEKLRRRDVGLTGPIENRSA